MITYHLIFQNPPSGTTTINVPNATAPSKTPNDLMIIMQTLADLNVFTSPYATYKLVPRTVTVESKSSDVLWENH